MTLRRRITLARSAGLDARLAADVIRARRRKGPHGPPRLGISYPLREEAGEDRLLARGIAGALEAEFGSVLLLPLVSKTLRPRLPAIDTLLLLSPISHAAELPPDLFVVAWVRSTAAAWPSELLRDADLVLAGSGPLADEIAALTGIAPTTMWPAVAATTPATVTSRGLDLVHLGDGQRNAARLARYLGSDTSARVHVYGPGWADSRFVLPTDEASADAGTADLFHRSRIVIGLSDTRRRSIDPDLLRAALGGALPITDDSEAAVDIFGPLLPSFSDRHELRSVLDGADDESQRTDAVQQLATAIVANHTYDARASEIAERIAEEQHKPLVAVKICPPNTDVMEQWGDTHFGRQFAVGMRRNGFRSAVQIRPNWYDTPDAEDVAVHVRGLEPYEPQPGTLNLLWIISHPDEISPAECNRYDAVLCASHAFAASLRARVDVPVHTMHQAADPAVFRYTAARPALRSDLLFVGNARLPVRQVPRWLLELDEPLTIYGARWEETAERRFVQGDFVPNHELHELYRSSDVVINDHWADMRNHGFISNRVFDALACGAFVISDHLDAIPELFGSTVPTFSTKHDLAAVLAAYKDDPAARARHALDGRRIVLEHHTFDVRANQLREIIHRLRPNLLSPE